MRSGPTRKPSSPQIPDAFCSYAQAPPFTTRARKSCTSSNFSTAPFLTRDRQSPDWRPFKSLVGDYHKGGLAGEAWVDVPPASIDCIGVNSFGEPAVIRLAATAESYCARRGPALPCNPTAPERASPPVLASEYSSPEKPSRPCADRCAWSSL